MKQEKHKPFDPMKKWIAEAGTDSPEDGFYLSVLRKIEVQPKAATVYRPVISPLAWVLIFVPIAAIIAWSIFFAPAQQDNATILDTLQKLKFTVPKISFFDFNFPSPHLSPQFLLGICAFFILGFLMIIGTIRNKHVDV